MQRVACLTAVLWAALAIMLAAGQSPARAQLGSGKPIRIIVNVPPGGASDTIARLLQTPLGEALGQPIVVENKPGGGGIIGIEAMVRSPADGSVLALAASSVAASPALYSKLPYDVLKDIRPITIVARSPNVLSVHPASPFRSLADIVAAARQAPGKVIVVSSGNGSAQHFGLEQLKIATSTDILHLPYRGAGPAFNDLVAGQVQIGLLNIVGTLPYVRTGQLRALAVTSPLPSKALPDVPSVAEVIPGFDFVEWFAITAPGALPDVAVERLYAALVKAARTPDFMAKLAATGMEPELNTPAEFRALMQAEHDKLGAIARKAGIKLD